MKFTFRGNGIKGDFQPPRTETDRWMAGFLRFQAARLALRQEPLDTANGIRPRHR